MISLKIQNRMFNVKKELLCEYSDYFQAMFNGKYVENEQKEISIDMLEPDIMEIIIKYMQIGLIDLSEYSTTTVGDIAVTASFLQIKELIKQIEYFLDLQLSVSNWIDTMSIAEKCLYTKLEKQAIVHGLLSFKNMKPEYLPTIHTLSWYLSHPYLDSENELDIFKFGYQWILSHETGVDSLLIVLGCVDINRITRSEISDIKDIMREYENSLAAKVVDCWHYLMNNRVSLTSNNLQKQKSTIFEMFTERVYTEVYNLVENSTVRRLIYTPVIPIWLLKESILQFVPHCLYSYTKERKFEQWLEVAEKNMWGWMVASWGPNKIVVVCGEQGRGTGMFMQDVKVYDTLKKEWTRHGVQLPPRRHAGLVVVGDSLYIVGGVGSFRIVLDTAIIYDLKQRSFRKIAKVPDAIQSPAVCLHENRVYTAGPKKIYQYIEDTGIEDTGIADHWRTVVSTHMRMSCLQSFRKYIYCIQSYFNHLYRFRPGVDEKLEIITSFSSPPATICNLCDHLVAFSRTFYKDTVTVEQYRGETPDEKPKIVYQEIDRPMRVNDVAGTCVVVTESPPITWEVSQYLRRYLQHYDYE